MPNTNQTLATLDANLLAALAANDEAAILAARRAISRYYRPGSTLGLGITGLADTRG